MINIIGTIFGSSGYARHTKELFNALYKINQDMHIECQKPQGWEMQVNDAELNAITNETTNDMIGICIGTPPEWPFHYTDPYKKFYGFLVWEGTNIPAYWEKYMEDERVTAIFVPSNHIKDAILNTYKCSKPIYILPHGVDNLRFQRDESIDKKQREFTFLVNKGWNLTPNDRGGVPIAVKAFAEEFGEDDDVRLILKINPAYLGGADIYKVSNAFKQLGLPENRNKIHVNIDNCSDKELVEIYSESDVIINSSYGEGFNLPLLEAMACKVVPLTSYFGGQLDYCNDKNSFIITKGEFVKPADMQYEEGKWFRIDTEELKKQMRTIYENQENINIKKEKAYDKALKYTWNKTAEEIIKIIEEDGN